MTHQYDDQLDWFSAVLQNDHIDHFTQAKKDVTFDHLTQHLLHNQSIPNDTKSLLIHCHNTSRYNMP